MAELLCIVCRTPLPPQGPGQRRLYCSPACRTRAYRQRKMRVDEALLRPRSAAHPIDQLVEAVITAQWLVGTLRRLARDSDPALGVRCGRVADNLDRALSEHFPEAVGRADAAVAALQARLDALPARRG